MYAWLMQSFIVYSFRIFIFYLSTVISKMGYTKLDNLLHNAIHNSEFSHKGQKLINLHGYFYMKEHIDQTLQIFLFDDGII